ncbi:MAG: group III truncated hemoglobin [Cyclobacteriaceae bacterium]
MKPDIQSRSDIEKLVNTFYDKVRAHAEIGRFFNETITDWPEHLSKLADFWEANLFFVSGFRGNPMKTHIEVDAKFNHEIDQAHFGNWLELWMNTLDELFEGEKANLAKERARNMAHMIYLRIFNARKLAQS